MQAGLGEKEKAKAQENETTIDEDVAKIGFEFALLKNVKEGNGKVKELIAQYGKVYLGVTVVLSSVNYAVCYGLIRQASPLPSTPCQPSLSPRARDVKFLGPRDPCLPKRNISLSVLHEFPLCRVHVFSRSFVSVSVYRCLCVSVFRCVGV